MITINEHSLVPAYLQIVNGVIDDVSSGVLKTGDRLPSVRKLAANLDIAPGTVAKAYTELEQRGLASSRGRRGTFITADDKLRYAEAQVIAQKSIQEIKDLGFGPQEVLELVTRELDP